MSDSLQLIQRLFAPYAEQLDEVLEREKKSVLWFASKQASSYPSFLLRCLDDILPRNIIYLLPSQQQALAAYRELLQLLGEDRVAILFSTQNSDHDIDLQEKRIARHRVADDLRKVERVTPKCYVVYIESALEYIAKPDPEARKILKLDQQISPESLEDFLQEKNFKKVDFVSQPGQYAIRGGILDVFSYLQPRPYRLEFFGDTIDSIRLFEIGSQLSTQKVNQAIIVNYEAETDTQETIFDLVDKPLLCGHFSDIKPLLEKDFSQATSFSAAADRLEQALRQCSVIDFSLETSFRYHWRLNPSIYSSSFGEKKKVDRFFAEMESYYVRGFDIFIVCATDEKAERIERLLKKQLRITFRTVVFDLYRGFVDEFSQVVVYAEHEIFGRVKQARMDHVLEDKKKLFGKEMSSIQPGDYVTHIDYGIGQFFGLVRKNVSNMMQDFIRVIFSQEATLDFSIEAFYKIGKYKDKDTDPPPKLSNMGGKAWSKLKQNAHKKLKTLAIDLTRLYSERRAQKGISFTPDLEMLAQLEGSFLYEDTPDQKVCIEAVKSDMKSSYPMDRLVCGDVGFGKTEIAVRAAFIAATSGYQVIVLVPTTILCLQHYNTFQNRYNDFPIRVAYLNRFVSPKKVMETWEGISKGDIDVIITTHKIFSKKADFKNLGLLVIDEEQKFGVAAKEKIRNLKKNIDTLVLSATPIPRTLKFSIMGLRDLSSLSTPPSNRVPVHTEIIKFDMEKIVPILEKEMERGGQIFMVNNRIANLESLAQAIQAVVPGIRVIFAHGRMGADELEKKMLTFINGEYDVLVATNIIENGLDIPNANTILINDAHRFGLSDLHQMRGRVGRSNKQAYCYLIAPDLDAMPEKYAKRLKALVYFSDIGSGIQIAMQDLETRGAGDLFGAEQSGFVNEMGYDTYLKIIEETLQEIQDETQDQTQKIAFNMPRNCLMDMDIPFSLPSDYIEDSKERLSLYTRSGGLKLVDQVDAFLAELEDRFGKAPLQVRYFICSIKLRLFCQKLGLEKVIFKRGFFIGHFPRNPVHPFFESFLFQKIETCSLTSPFQIEQKITKENKPLLIIKAPEPFEDIFTAFETLCSTFQKSIG